MNRKIFKILFGCDLGVGQHGAEGHHNEIHQETVAVSRQEWLGKVGGCGQGDGWMALRIQRVKYIGPSEGVDIGGLKEK